jgi:hypothetical protein
MLISNGTLTPGDVLMMPGYLIIIAARTQQAFSAWLTKKISERRNSLKEYVIFSNLEGHLLPEK